MAVGGEVTLTLPADGARTLTALQLEAGDASLTGRLGAATGGWRLTVSSDRPLHVVNVVATSTGHWNNLSTTAVRGAAPANRAGFNDRFVGESAVLEADGGRLALTIMETLRFSETVQSDGMFTTNEGGYDYVGLGPDAGRLTLDYDDGTRCRANLYFSSRTSGWFASSCSGGVDPEDTRSGGDWFVGDDEVSDPVGTTYGVDEALPGVPISGLFAPAQLSGGSVRASGGSTTIDLDEGGYFEVNDGPRYTCASAGGCQIVDGTVTRGSVTGRTAGPAGGENDRFPVFPAAGRPGDRTYTVGTAIDALTLPEATGGNPQLTYSLSPDVPGLSFDAAARRLTGTPAATGLYAMSYTVTDVDGDLYTIRFTIEVDAGEVDTAVSGGTDGDCYVGLTLNPRGSCNYPGTDEAFTVTPDGRGRFIFFTSGSSINLQNSTINGRTYDFAASEQGDGVWRIDRVEGSTADPGDGDARGGTDPATSSTPSSPQNISVTREGSNVRVSWDASPGATRYEVWRCDTRNGPLDCEDGVFFDRSNWRNLARNLTDTGYVDENPPTSDSIIPFAIHYVVQACNRSGCSGAL
ncbi:MAG: putative Ig domain-containing protein [Bryobacterales bacterium]|nr:putative Ig domain-containing protein [Bryobacterales bacterium]